MAYFPETTVIKERTALTRERTLPPHAITDAAQAVQNEPVEAVQTVLVGSMLGDYYMLDIIKGLRLKSRPTLDELQEFIVTDTGLRVQVGQEIARKGQGRRARVMQSPVEGVVVGIDGSRIIVQEARQTVEIKARIPGRVENASPHRVVVTGKGAVIQCAWGNGRFIFHAFKALPPDGFVGLSRMDSRISEYKNVVIYTREPLNAGNLLVAKQQEVGGVVGPSMSANLREMAMQLTFPVLLTEGFGHRRPTELIYRLLDANMGLQAVFDATIPDHWSADRPEIMIPLPSEGATLVPPALDQALTPGMQVRIVRAPWDSVIGTVEELPQTPQLIDNGLRVPCARVRLSPDQVILVPLANLELLG
ncbi:MAG: hypothetical protein K8S97_08785 [Anaerolineae bacterium]|nr:hypothetical protein [Anaerolineae bacterium]